MAREPLEQLLRRFNIGRWDYLIVGDGSGSGWGGQVGWASVVVEANTLARTVFAGGMNRGTVNIGEIMAYLQPLEFLSSQEIKRREETKRHRAVYVHILTDSQYCRNTGNVGGRMARANAGLWAVFDAFKRHGFVIRWHWVKRETCGLNSYCDKVSRLVRLLHKGYNPQYKISQTGLEKRSVYEINPES